MPQLPLVARADRWTCDNLDESDFFPPLFIALWAFAWAGWWITSWMWQIYQPLHSEEEKIVQENEPLCSKRPSSWKWVFYVIFFFFSVVYMETKACFFGKNRTAMIMRIVKKEIWILTFPSVQFIGLGLPWCFFSYNGSYKCNILLFIFFIFK